MAPTRRQAHDGHVPVLLDEVLRALRPRPGCRYLDGTLGLGGHSRAILQQAGEGAELLGLDRDKNALALAGERLLAFGDRVHLAQTSYSNFSNVLDEIGWDAVDGALLDLGVSSLQLDTPERGFSFIEDGPLDMRMGTATGAAPASALVNKSSFNTLKRIIIRLGEEPLAGRIARAIIEARRQSPIETTLQLASVVENAYPAKLRATARNHPATRTFQALRMEVNRELDELRDFLAGILDRVRPGGRVAVISFHSLEDRIVKRFFRDEAKGCICPREQPICICGHVARVKVLTRKPVMASEEEVDANPRSRSAKLRVAEVLPLEDPS